MKILLINPPVIVPSRRYFTEYIFQPIGLAYLAAVLEKEGYKVSILDVLAEDWENEYMMGGYRYCGLTYDEIGKRIKAYSPDIVGITTPSSRQSRCFHKLAEVVKMTNNKTVTIIGGVDSSIRPEYYLSNPNIDIAVIGEGENTLLELVKKIEAGQEGLMKDVAGIAYRINGKFVRTPPRKLIENLDLIPFPARHLLPMEKYFEAARSGRSPRSVSTFGKRWATIVTSRGCPYGCVFCSGRRVWGRRWRARSPENVVDEIEYLIREFKIEHLDVEDDNMTLDMKRAGQICELVVQRKLEIEWSTPNGVRADRINENLIIKMKKSGCKRLVFAPESGDQRVVNSIIKKNLDLTKVEEGISLCKKYGIAVNCFFIIGLIGETKDNIRTTLGYAKKLRKMGAEGCGVYIATPLYGTELYEQAKQKGYLKDKFSDEDLIYDIPLIETPEFNADDIREFYREGLWLNPLLSRSRLKLYIAMTLKNPKRSFALIMDRLFKSHKSKSIKDRRFCSLDTAYPENE